ncbi:unnamed protein product, partial [Staurois parvus]
MRGDQRVNCVLCAVSVCFTVSTLLWMTVHSHPKQCARADRQETVLFTCMPPARKCKI